MTECLNIYKYISVYLYIYICIYFHCVKLVLPQRETRREILVKRTVYLNATMRVNIVFIVA